MAESHEPSYYEIALTNSQVVVAFVILLVCLVSAFFSGVWIGRESANKAQEQMVAQITPPTAPEEKKEGRSVEDLSFFDDRSRAAAGRSRDEAAEAEPSPSTPPRASNDSTLLEDMGGSRAGRADRTDRDTEEPPARAAAPSLAPATTPPLTPEERRARRRERQQAQQAAAQQAQAGTTGTTPAAPGARGGAAARTPREAEPAVPKGAMVIQVFSSQDKSQADRIRKQLVGGGQKAYLSPVDVAGHTMYRVRIGPFTSRTDAQKVADKVRKSFKLDTWITE